MTQQELAAHYGRLSEIQHHAEMAKTRKGREELRRGWERQQQAEEERQAAEQARAEQQEAENRDRQRRIHDAELESQQAWAQKRDRLAAELVEAHNARSVIELAVTSNGTTDDLPVEVAERLRLAVYQLAAEQLVEKAEQAVEDHRRANGSPR